VPGPKLTKLLGTSVVVSGCVVFELRVVVDPVPAVVVVVAGERVVVVT
jgi:hypothetical protein